MRRKGGGGGAEGFSLGAAPNYLSFILLHFCPSLPCLQHDQQQHLQRRAWGGR